MTGRPAAFLDRDGTIIEDVGYLRDPDDVRLLPGAGSAIRRLNAADIAAVVVTNQSGIARGLLTVDDYEAGERRLDQLLAREGARLDGRYYCPHLPELTGPCDCRKPAPLLYRRAAEQLNLDLRRSWWVGDRLRDVLAAEQFGGHGVLVGTSDGSEESLDRGFVRAVDLAAAVDLILAQGDFPRP